MKEQKRSVKTVDSVRYVLKVSVNGVTCAHGCSPFQVKKFT